MHCEATTGQWHRHAAPLQAQLFQAPCPHLFHPPKVAYFSQAMAAVQSLHYLGPPVHSRTVPDSA